MKDQGKTYQQAAAEERAAFFAEAKAYVEEHGVPMPVNISVAPYASMMGVISGDDFNKLQHDGLIAFFDPLPATKNQRAAK